MKNKDSFADLYAARHEPENLRPIAELYWRILLASGIAVGILAIGFGVWEFSSVMTTISNAGTIDPLQQTPPIDRTKLENTLNMFSQRQAEFEIAKGTTASTTDPSK